MNTNRFESICTTVSPPGGMSSFLCHSLISALTAGPEITGSQSLSSSDGG
ncbi:MAG: hypothetical protein ACKPEN_10720 [Planktothrix sp.]